MRTIFVLALTILLLQGCSYRDWYTGFVEGQRFQCNKLNGIERQNCLSSIEENYDRYMDERRNAPK